MKTSSLLILGLSGLLAGWSLAAPAQSPSSSSTDNSGTSLKDIPPEAFAPPSAGVGDVVKLAKSGVSETVVISYIKNSDVAYQPSAGEIIQLKQQGISADVITAMLNRGGEVRAQGMQDTTANAASSATTQSSVAQAPPQSTVVYTEPQVVYADPTPNVVYIGTSYGYPAYWGNCYWPRSYYYPRTAFYGGYRGGYPGGYGGGFVAVRHGSGGFRGGGGFHASRGGSHHR